VVLYSLAELVILPQNILPYTIPIEINEIIKRLPNKKSPGHDLITNALLKKSNHSFVYFIQFTFKNWLFSS